MISIKFRKNTFYQRIEDSSSGLVLLFFIFNFCFIHLGFSQCDPTTIDPCEIGKNAIIQACYHAQIAKTSNGYSITGEDLATNGTSNSTSLTNIPGPSYPMPPGVFPVWGAIGGRTQAVFLASNEKIYAVGEEDLLIDFSNTFSSSWSETRLELPAGVTVCDVNKWQGTAGSGSDNSNNNASPTGDRDGFLVFSTVSGEAYITGDGAQAIQALASNTRWTKIDMPTGIDVVNFGVGYRTLLIQGSDGNLYTSGVQSYLGNGTKADLREITKLAVQPNISVFGITQIEAGYHSYLVLDGDGSIHVLGENSEGGLGVGNTKDVTYWSKVGAECSTGILNSVAYISTLSTHDYRINSSAILVDGTVRSWGSNSKQAITSGNEDLLPCPIVPTGNNRNAVAISNGGHISPYVNTSVQICNIGHNKDGAFGDGNDEDGDYGEYTCRNIPGMPEICGTKEADLGLEKTTNNLTPRTGDDIIFTITVTNYGPEASTGSFVRDQLSPAFYYLEDDSNGDYNSITGLWKVGPLEVGESASLNITVKVIEAGQHANYAQILVDNEVDINSTPGDDSNNQNDDDRIVLTVTLCPINNSDYLLCPGDSLLIGSEWIFEAGTYLETIPLGIECDSLHISNISYVEGPPKAQLDVDCDALQFNLSVDPSSSWLPSWDNGSTNFQTVYNSSSNQAILTLEAQPDCIDEQIFDLPPFADLGQIPNFEDTTLLENTLLMVNSLLDTSEWQIEWSPADIVNCVNCSIAEIIAKESTRVTLSLEHISGCRYQSSFFLNIEKAPQHIYTPNIFSPNNDPFNEEWTFFTTPNITVQECRIYDRWGSLKFISNEQQPKWDGRFEDQECLPGVYLFVIKYKDSDQMDQVIAGDITLIR